MRKKLRLLKNEFVSNYDDFFRFLLAFGIFPLVLIGLLGERGIGKDVDKEEAKKYLFSALTKFYKRRTFKALMNYIFKQ